MKRKRKMSNNLLHELNKLEEGATIRATIRHCNKKLALKDESVILTKTSDGWYIDGGPDELSYNWDIIDFKEI